MRARIRTHTQAHTQKERERARERESERERKYYLLPLPVQLVKQILLPRTHARARARTHTHTHTNTSIKPQTGHPLQGVSPPRSHGPDAPSSESPSDHDRPPSKRHDRLLPSAHGEGKIRAQLRIEARLALASTCKDTKAHLCVTCGHTPTHVNARTRSPGRKCND